MSGTWMGRARIGRTVVAAVLAMLAMGTDARAQVDRPPPPPSPPAERDGGIAAPVLDSSELPPGGTLRAVTPARILDTRIGLGAPAAKVAANTSIVVDVAGQGGVPSTGASGVVINVTATGSTAGSFLTVWPQGARPATSNLNVQAGVTRANLVQVGLGPDGAVRLYNQAGSTHVIVDVMGWIVQSPGPDDTGRFHSLVPSRILDTRNGTGAAVGPVGPGGERELVVIGRGGVPEDGVTAVAVNLTAVNPTATTYLTAWPGTETRPTASVVNTSAGRNVPNRVIVRIGDTGTIKLFNSAGQTHLLVDVVGWYGAQDDTFSGASFTPLAPARIADTRTGAGGVPATTIATGVTLAVTVAGRGGVPDLTGSVPPTAAVLNVTAADPQGGSYLTLWPTGSPRPVASDLNMQKGVNAPNLVIVKLGPDGKVNVFNGQSPAHVIIDVMGYFAGDVALDESLRVLTAAESNAVTAVTAATVTFSTPPVGLNVVDVLNSAPSAGAPFGFLRRVVSIGGDGAGQVVVTTEPVSLDEVIASGEFSGAIPLEDAAAGPLVGRTGTSAPLSVARTVDFERSLEGSSGGGTASATLSGFATMSAGANFGIDYDFPASFEAELSASTSMAAELSFVANGSYELASKRYDLGEIEFRTFVFSIGPAIVVVQPEFELAAEVRGRLDAGFSVTASRNASMTAGFRASDSLFGDLEFDPFVSSTAQPLTVDVEPPSASVSVTAQLYASLEMEFYGGLELGVGLDPRITSSVSTDDCTLRSTFGLDAHVSAELELFGKDLLNKEKVFEDVVSPQPLHNPIVLAGCDSGEWEIEPLAASALAGLVADDGIQVVSAGLGGSGQVARFRSPDDGVSFPNGIVLTSGDVGATPGPNTFPDTSGGGGGAGLAALSAIVGAETYDASTLGLQFVPAGDWIEVDWQFASEEYPEWVGSEYNDAAAIFVNGVNCAGVASGFSHVPATVNAINPQSNASQFLDNSGGAIDVQADGLTKGQKCLARVNPGVTNTIVFAVADTSDAAFDSWLFVQANSFDSPPD